MDGGSRLSEIWDDLEAAARAAGVLRIGASGIDDAHADRFSLWLDAGRHGSMEYLRRNEPVRRAPQARYPWARSAVAITVPYAAERPHADPGALSHRVARYALGDDYHDVLDGILRSLENVISRRCPAAKSWRYVDTGPLSDRSYAAQAGLGWIGRNAMLIDGDHGSYVFIGILLTSLENDLPRGAVEDRCGSCMQCVDACPTGAILPDRTVDSVRCISHTTIEVRGPIDPLAASSLAGNVFGCDICQEACPWNRDPAPTHSAFVPREAYRATPVTDLLRMSQSEFSSLFRKSPVKRAKRAGMIRNAVLALPQIPQDACEALAAEDEPGIAAALASRLAES